MAPIARALADCCRVLEPFQRGSGDEPLTVAQHIEDLHELITFYAEECRPALIGSSWGAMLALAYAAAHPASSGSLVLVGCGTFDLHSRAVMQETIQSRMSDSIRQNLRAINEQVVNEDERLKAQAALLLPLYSYEPAKTAPENQCVDAQAHLETWDDMLRLQAGGAYPAAFASIRVPVLMLHGSFDPHPGGMIRASLQPYMPQLEYREFDRCGHYPWLEKAVSDEFFEVLRDWLGQHLPNAQR